MGSRLASLLLFVGVSALAVFLWWELSRQHDLELLRAVRSRAEGFRAAVAQVLESRHRAVERMARRMEGPGVGREDWVADASRYRAHHPGFESFTWLDSDGGRFGSVPRDHEERRTESLNRILTSTRRSGRSDIQPTEGGTDAASRDDFWIVAPLRREAGFQGWLVARLDLSRVLEAILRETQEAGYGYSLGIGEVSCLESEPEGEARFRVLEGFRIQSDDWRVVLWATPALIAEADSPVPEWVLLVGIWMALLMAGTVHFAASSRGRARLLAEANDTLTEEIARRDRLEEKVQRRTVQLEEANRELESFSYSVSHDLRAPLRHMDGFVQLLVKKADQLDETSRRYISIIQESAQKMGRLIDDLLAFSRTGRADLRLGSVDLNRLVEKVRTELASEEEGRDVVWEVDELPEVCGDREMIRLVLSNLLSNALKYTGKEEVARIAIRGEVEANEVRITVEDNGVGFDDAYAEKMFGVFQRLHRAEEFEGTGIGLANVQRIVHRHGGRVWAEGSPGEGAKVGFSLSADPEKLTSVSEEEPRTDEEIHV